MVAGITWFLGCYLAARFMADTGGPTPQNAPPWFYVLIVASWPLWTAAWIVALAWAITAKFSRWPR